MASKFVRLLPLALLCLSLNLLVQHSNAGAIDPKLITQACDRCKDKQKCLDWLQDDEKDEELRGISKADLNEIAFFALKKIEKEAVIVSEAVAMTLANGSEELAPATQQGLSECKDHYIPAVDLIEQTVDAVANKVYPDAIKYLKASTLDLNACQKSLAKLQNGDGTTEKPTRANVHTLMAINHRDLLALHVEMAQTILEFAAASAAPAS